MHGVLAVALWSGAPDEVLVSSSASVAAAGGTEMVWFEGAAESPIRAKPSAAVPRDTPRARPASPKPGAEQHRKQAPAAPMAASPSVDSSRSSEAPAESPSGASLAEAAARGAEQGSPGSETGAVAASGGVDSRSTAAPGNGGPGGSALGDLRVYARGLATAVARQRRYPEIAVRLGMQGTAHVHLRVRQDGSLMEPPRLVTSSGQEVLDAEALRMAKAAAPFEPLPGGAARTDAGFVIPVVFSLRAGR